METNTDKIIPDETTADYRFFAVQPHNEPKIWAEGKRKTAGGLKHFYGWYPQMTRAEALTLVHQAPLFTPRPYRLGFRQKANI